MDREKDREEDERSRPGIPRPGQQADQQQQPGAPPQPGYNPLPPRSSQWQPPTTGNPDLDPAGVQGGRIDLRDPNPNPLVPQGMLFDPRQLLDAQRRASQGSEGGSGMGVPPGARFDPFGPPDPSLIGPGRGPLPDTRFGDPDPDHFQPPGMPQQPPGGLSKTLKGQWPPRGRGFPPSGGGPPLL